MPASAKHAETRAKRAIVTGSSRGLGRSVVAHFRQRGWEVHGVARTGSEHIADVTDAERIGDVFAQACGSASNAAGLDLLVCCASNAMGGRLRDIPLDRVAKTIESDVIGAMVPARAALPYLRMRPGSTIVLVNSFAAFAGIPGFAGYSAAKAGLDAFAQAIRIENEGRSPAILQVFVGALEEDSEAARPAWNAQGETVLRAMRPLRLFAGASRPMPAERIALRIESALGRSRDLYLPPSLAWMHGCARRFPGAFRLLVRSFYRHRLPEMLAEIRPADSADRERPT